MSCHKFNATIEILTGRRAAIVTLTDERGQWSGSERFDVRPRAFEGREALRARLYDLGYRVASQKAAIKGGRIETYRAE